MDKPSSLCTGWPNPFWPKKAPEMVTHLVIKEDVTAAATSKMGSGYVKVMICVQCTCIYPGYSSPSTKWYPLYQLWSKGSSSSNSTTAASTTTITNYSYTVEGFNCSALLVLLHTSFMTENDQPRHWSQKNEIIAIPYSLVCKNYEQIAKPTLIYTTKPPK